MSAPSPPIIFPRPRVDLTSIQIWWNAPSSLPYDLSGYILSSVEQPLTTTSYPATAGTATINNLTTGQPHTATLIAVDINGGTSDPAIFRSVIPGYKFSAVQNVTATTGVSGEIITQWSAVSDSANVTGLLGYVVTAINIDINRPKTARSTYPTDTSHRMVVDYPTETYTMLVQAVNDPGYSSYTSLSAPVSPGFIPSNVTSGTMTLWLDAADTTTLFKDSVNRVTQNGELVSRWNSKVGTTVFTNIGAAPRYSLQSLKYQKFPGVIFDFADASGLISGSITLGSSGSITSFIVSHYIYTPLVKEEFFNMGIIHNSSQNLAVTMDALSGANTQYNITAGTSESLGPSANPVYFPGILTCIISDISNSYAYEWSCDAPPFSSSGTSASADLATSTILTLGDGAPKISMHEILIYDGTLSSSDIASVQSYLNTKWVGLSYS